MEHLRVFLAIGLSFLVFLLWNVLFVEKKGVIEQGTEQAQMKEEGAKSKEAPQAQIEKKFETKEPLPVQPQAPDMQEALTMPKKVYVQTPLFEVTLNENGGMIDSVKLNDYREAVEKGSERKELLTPEFESFVGRTGFNGNALSSAESGYYKLDSKDQTIRVENGKRDVTLTWTSPKGIVVQKTYTFSADSYLVGFDVAVKNGSETAIDDQMKVEMQRQFKAVKGGYGFEGPSALVNDDLKQIKIGDIEEEGSVKGSLKWIALEGRYFMSAVIPKSAGDAGMRAYQGPDGLVGVQYVQSLGSIASGTLKQFDYDIFFGPKSLKLLKGMEANLERAINFGMFDIIAKPFLLFMIWLHDHVVGNYGVAIILLTIATKALMWPLGNKSYKSMNAMKRLQPLMGEIREKYKHDKKRMNQEMMGLYKTYKINPMGGCLPMLLQIPVFLALYRMLYQAIELRHAPFFLWINDLSAPDRLLRFGFSIPFMQPPYGIPVLTIIMGATMLLQQKMSPPPGDPTQAKMMMLMPIVFTVIFINFSSGLVLYWLVNNVISIGQQYYISKKHA